MKVLLIDDAEGSTLEIDELLSAARSAKLDVLELSETLDMQDVKRLLEAHHHDGSGTASADHTILDTVLGSLPGVIYRCRDNAGRSMLFVSEGCTALTGYPAEELVGDGAVAWSELVHPADLVPLRQQLDDAVQRDLPYRVQYRIVDRYDREHWVTEYGRAIRDGRQRVAYLEGFIHDVSEQRAAEQAVRDSEAWYRTLFESANDAIFLMAGERIVDCNSKTLRMFGRTIDDIVGVTPAALSPAEQPDGSSSAIASLGWVEEALRGEAQFFEWQHLRPDGEVFDVEVNLNRVEVAGRTFLQAMVRDITDRKRSERALARRDAILEAVSFAAAKFLKTSSWEELASEVLEHFGRAADASRVYLFEGYRGDDGRELARQRFEWIADGVPQRIHRAELQRFSAPLNGLARWAETIMVGGLIHGPRSGFPAAEQVFLELQGVLSIVVVPVFAAGDLWGFLGVDECRRERRWTEGEIEAIRAAAEILGGAIFVDLARRTVANRAEALEILNRVNTMLASTLDATTVIQEIADLVRVRCGVDHVSVSMLDKPSKQLSFVAWSGYDAPERHSGLTVDGEGLIARAAREGRPLWVPDVSCSETYLAGDERVLSEYAVPLMVHDEALGVLNCESFAVDGIGVWQRDVIDRLASQAAVALRNAEIVRELGGVQHLAD